jgi:adenylyltransferase/sulfurtransferase
VFQITKSGINFDECKSKLASDRAGALVCFEGRVRNHNENKRVSSLEYEVFHELALKEGLAIIAEAKKNFDIIDAYAIHREGRLQIEDSAVWVGALAAHRDGAFRAARYIIDRIKTRLPIWKKEFYVEGPSEWVACTHHDGHFCKEEYYHQQSGAVGPGGQGRLQASRVLVVGLGGLGSPVTLALAGAGVGTLSLCDGDRLELSNLHRQTLYSSHDIGIPKATLAKERIQALNPFCNVRAIDCAIDAKNVDALVAEHDLVVDCTDNFATKFLLHDACFKQRRSLVQASLYAGDGVLQAFQDFDQGCMRCLWPEEPDASCARSCTDAGVLGAQTALLGSMQALQVLHIILERSNRLQDISYVNLDDLSVIRVPRKKNTQCPLCSESEPINLKPIFTKTRFFDVRNISKADYLTSEINADDKTILICQKGLRSKRYVDQLRSQGFDKVYSLRGGMESLTLE